MAGKRSASNELTHDNWDADYEPEEAGTFNKAPEDVLKKRVFKTAKRRIAKGPDEGSLNVFNPANLAKFGPKPTAAPSEMFGFLSKIQSNVSKTNGVSEAQDNTKTTGQFSFGTKIEPPEIKINTITLPIKPEGTEAKSSLPMFNFGNPDKKNESLKPASIFTFGNQNVQKSLPLNNSNSTFENKEKSKEIEKNLDNYYAKLKGLNQSVAKWINKHVESNPLINLQPIFEDYQKFFSDIEKDRDTNSKPEEKTKEVPISGFSFKPQASSENNVESKPLFKFGNTTTPKLNENKSDLPTQTSQPPMFSFGNKSSKEIPTSESVPKFTFGSGNTTTAPFTFGTPSTNINPGTVTPAPSKSEEKNDEESDEPPKVEVKQVEEEGNIYTIRCKVFIKKDGSYVEKGVGSLFLKPVPESNKIQLIVRAHNSLGNVLCNFILSKSIPTQRTGKNNVMIVCIPTPESQPPPVPILIRVKTEEDADQLLQTLEKHKK